MSPPLPTHAGVSLRDQAGFLAMVVGMFMAILDIQIVASSLSEIRAGLSASNDEISWIQTGYLIAEVIMIPLSGWLARVFSTRLLFVASCLTFTLASAACAFAWDIWSMVVFRAIQGFLGGAMIPTVFSTSFRLYPSHKRAGVSVMIGMVATMAPTLGPTLGGWLTQSLSWHWLFLINVVPGILVCTAVFALVRIDRPDLKLLKGFDLPGVVFVAVFLGCLQYVLEEGPIDDWFQSDTILSLSLLSGTAGTAFFWRELTTAHPVVDLRAFANRNFAIGCLFSFVIGIGLYGSVYIVPLFLGQVRHYNSLDIGIVMMVVGAAQLLSAPVAGILSKHMDLRWMLTLGLFLFGLGVWMNGEVTAEWGYDEFFWPLAVRGFSLMLCFVPINNIALGTLPLDKLQNASGLYNLMRNLGGAMGLAVINTLLSSRLDLHLARLGEHITAANHAAMGAMAGLSARLAPALEGQHDQAALKLLGDLVRREAVVLTFADVLHLMALLFFLSIPLAPLLRKVKPPAPSSAPSAGH